MIRNIVFYSKKICFCLIVFLFSSIIMIMNVSAASYSMDDYQEVIEKVNETYDKKLL